MTDLQVIGIAGRRKAERAIGVNTDIFVSCNSINDAFQVVAMRELVHLGRTDVQEYWALVNKVEKSKPESSAVRLFPASTTINHDVGSVFITARNGLKVVHQANIANAFDPQPQAAKLVWRQDLLSFQPCLDKALKIPRTSSWISLFGSAPCSALAPSVMPLPRIGAVASVAFDFGRRQIARVEFRDQVGQFSTHSPLKCLLLCFSLQRHVRAFFHYAFSPFAIRQVFFGFMSPEMRRNTLFCVSGMEGVVHARYGHTRGPAAIVRAQEPVSRRQWRNGQVSAPCRINGHDLAKFNAKGMGYSQHASLQCKTQNLIPRSYPIVVLMHLATRRVAQRETEFRQRLEEHLASNREKKRK